MKEICIYYKNAPARHAEARARMAAAAEGQEGRIKKKSRFRASSAPIEIPFISRVAAAPHLTAPVAHPLCKYTFHGRPTVKAAS